MKTAFRNKLSKLLNDIQGNVGIIFVMIVAAVIVVIVLLPPEIPPSNNDGDYCRQFATHEEYMTSPSGVRYKLIKEEVPVLNQWVNDGKYNHYGTYEPYTDSETGVKYTIRHPQWGAGTSYQFASDVDPDQPFQFTYAEYGIVFRFRVDDNGEPLNTGLRVPVWGLAPVPILFMDIFQQVGAKPLPEYVLKCQDYPKNLDVERMMIPGQNTSINVSIPGLQVMHPVGDEPQGNPPLNAGQGQVARVEDLETIGVPEKNIQIPAQTESSDEAQLQAEWFLLRQSKFLIHTWWAPHCKPAIYLYPPKKQLVNVKVKPAGHLIYTDPLYPQNGWNVEAHPNGKLVWLDNFYGINSKGEKRNTNIYDYLYFESKIPDSVIQKPTKGWVIKSSETGVWYAPLNAHFNEILPKLGLSDIQTKDFIEYWQKALPNSQYYFVGIIDQKNVNEIEALEITPKPDEINRVRIYFEQLDNPKIVEAPVLENKKFELSDTEFKVVEWGGMVKNDPNHPFTCSQ